MGCLLLLQLNDVKAKFCLHHTRHVARIGQCKDCRVKLGHHFSSAKEAQIAALGCAAFVGRVLSGKLGKVSTGLQVGQKFLCLRLRGIFCARNQNVTGTHLRLSLEAVGFGFVNSAGHRLGSLRRGLIGLVHFLQPRVRQHFVAGHLQGCGYHRVFVQTVLLCLFGHGAAGVQVGSHLCDGLRLGHHDGAHLLRQTQ